MAERVPRVVVVGGGFAGLQAVKALTGAQLEVILLERQNYHLFQPLLYQVATAGLAPEDIVYPLRAILRGRKNVEFRMTEVQAVDRENKKVITDFGEISYDYLVVAVGARTNFFRMESVERNAFGLKNVADAMDVRNHIFRMFEMACQQPDPEVRRAMLTFVVAGGGATGVESAGGLAELIEHVLTKDYTDIDFGEVRLILLEGGDCLLPALPEPLCRFTAEKLTQKGVEVRFRSAVAEFDGTTITMADGKKLNTRTLIWAAGVAAEPLAARIGTETDKAGRAVINSHLQVPGHPEIFVVGDAACLRVDGRPLPMIAPVAVQQATTAARNIIALADGRNPEEFRYKDPGSLATIGRTSAVASMGRWQFRGYFAWVLWLVVHLIRLVGFRNRLLVLVNWAWDYFFYERAVRLILGEGRCTPGKD